MRRDGVHTIKCFVVGGREPVYVDIDKGVFRVEHGLEHYIIKGVDKLSDHLAR